MTLGHKNQPKYQKAFRRTDAGRFSLAKSGAKYRGLSWEITLEEFKSLRERPCFYCEGALPEAAPGLDRRDNSKGYSPENVVPCCRDCNRIRSDVLTQEEALVAVRAVKEYRNAQVSK